MSSPSFPLLSGHRIPALGFGTYADVDEAGKCYSSVLTALETGYRHLDCAAYYKNEDEVGRAIHDFLVAPNQKVTREDLFITTKVWNHLHEPADVEWSLRKSLRDLGLEYIDLFLVHWPIATKRDDDMQPLKGEDGKYVLDQYLTDHQEITWKAMESLHDAGLARSIGVSNWTIARLESLLSHARVKPVANQVEVHPFLPNIALLEYCTSKGIILEAYSPLGKLAAGKRLSAVPELKGVVERTGFTMAQVLIAWGVQRGYVVLPKSFTKERIEENFRLVRLDERSMGEVDGFAKTQKNRLVNIKGDYGYDVWADGE